MLRQNQAAVESAVAAAHKASYRAAGLAESWRDQGYADDLHQVGQELARIQRDLLRDRYRPSPPMS